MLCETLCVKGKFESINNKNVALHVNRWQKAVKVCLFTQWPTYAPQKVLIKSLIVPPPTSVSLSCCPLCLLFPLFFFHSVRLSWGLFITRTWQSQAALPPLLSWLPEPRRNVKPPAHAQKHTAAAGKWKNWRVRSLCMKAPLHLNKPAGEKKTSHKEGKTRVQFIFLNRNI